MRADEAVPMLLQTEPFRQLSAELAAEVASRSILRRYKKGAFIFSQGDPADALFVLLEGLAKVVVGSAQGEEMLLVTLQPPVTFGELGLIDSGVRSASVEVLKPAVALVLTRSTFDELRREHPALTEGVLQSMARMLRRLTAQASDFVFLDLPGRVAKLLCTLAEAKGDQGRPEIVLDLALTQGELAQMVGGSRQSVNQILRSLEARRLVDLERNRIVLKRIDLLRQRAGL